MATTGQERNNHRQPWTRVNKHWSSVSKLSSILLLLQVLWKVPVHVFREDYAYRIQVFPKVMFALAWIAKPLARFTELAGYNDNILYMCTC